MAGEVAPLNKAKSAEQIADEETEFKEEMLAWALSSDEFAVFFVGKFGKTFPSKLAELRPKVTPVTVTTVTGQSQWSQSCGRTFSPQ